ncbi:hypothetical protein FK220_001220 [Flavobacteriaceae bacterium TP-CH-4]|uniref:Membrane dipeptidase (Peptidase family M19) n=1 Tax=Pelagihabitans pacificus TaxID=2696054 RepID=A0A967AUQ7_9FLAO|nr:hypothetical protein [Pelagihabitans pacificus]NHF57942.1 hypothetical protein [Pelagihabitans pacificus]
MEKPIADLHCHPSLKPTNNSKLPNLWKGANNISTRRLFRNPSLGDRLRKLAIDLFLKNMAKYTQSNLASCYEGNNKLLFFALYPPERPFMKPARPFRKGTRSHQKLSKKIFKNLAIDSKVIRALTGFSEETAASYLDNIYNSETIDYFEDLLNEYQRIVKENGKPYQVPGYPTPARLKMIRNYKEYTETNKFEIAGIITVEGAHALARYKNEDLFEKENIEELDDNSRSLLEQSFVSNIETLKNPDEMAYTPFFITFSHHFNNLISGHAKSFKDAPNKIIPGFSNVFDQRKGLDKGFTDFGKKLITDHLLSKKNGKRILVDTKHMSLQCRDEYLAIVNNFWKQKKDRIPIVCSHTAINGISTRAESKKRKDTNQLDRRAYVSRWDINLTDEDIIDIFDSDGIIGICMHDGRMPGGKFKALVKQETRAHGSLVRVQRLHTQMFLTNIFHVVRINLSHIMELNKTATPKRHMEEAWKTVCLGTDFDGIIDPFDHFNAANMLNEFKVRCKEAIQYNFNPIEERKRAKILHVGEHSSRPYGKAELEELMMGMTPQEIVDKVFSDNLLFFMSKYFTDEYLM